MLEVQISDHQSMNSDQFVGCRRTRLGGVLGARSTGTYLIHRTGYISLTNLPEVMPLLGTITY